MTYTRLRSEVDNKVGRITLSKPDEFNRMPPAFWSEFPDAIEGMDATGAIRTIVIAAEGKHFTSGMDTAVFTSSRSGPEYEAGRRGERSRRHIARLQDSFSVIERVRMPVIAAIQGACIGGGVDMISACDMRYCTADAFFCIQEINIGMAADVGTLQRLPKLIPTGLMRELAYTGRRLFAEEAKSIGLVNEVYDTQSLMMDAVMSIAHEIAKKSPLAVASTKHLLDYGEEHSVSDTLDYQTLWMGSISQGGEMAKYFEAKQQGNEPKFDDLPPLSDN